MASNIGFGLTSTKIEGTKFPYDLETKQNLEPQYKTTWYEIPVPKDEFLVAQLHTYRNNLIKEWELRTGFNWDE